MRKTITFRILLLVPIVILILANIILHSDYDSYPDAVNGNIAEGYPFRYEDDQTYWSELSDLAVCGDHLYVLYDAKRVMSCYRLDGSYLCSFACQCRRCFLTCLIQTYRLFVGDDHGTFPSEFSMFHFRSVSGFGAADPNPCYFHSVYDRTVVHRHLHPEEVSLRHTEGVICFAEGKGDNCIQTNEI